VGRRKMQNDEWEKGESREVEKQRIENREQRIVNSE
jgi:hypothetical protein